jgi:hypothetical protein
MLINGIDEIVSGHTRTCKAPRLIQHYKAAKQDLPTHDGRLLKVYLDWGGGGVARDVCAAQQEPRLAGGRGGFV